MSYDQAAGRPTDRRCAVWYFGVMLHVLFTGRRMFEGETISHRLADVLRAEIDLSGLPAGVPRSVRELLRRCLERDPKRRLRDIGEARIALENAIERPQAQEDLVSSGPAKADSRWPWLVGALGLAVAAGSVLWTSLGPRPAPPPVQRFTLVMPNSGNLRQGDGVAIAISPFVIEIVLELT